MRRLAGLLAAMAVTVAACASPPDEIVLLTHDSFVISTEVLDLFEEQTGVAVQVFTGGDAGEVVSRAILTKDNPTADVIYGIDNTFLSRALDEEIFQAYESPALATVPEALKLDPEHRVTPIDVADVCVNYDKREFEAGGLPVPDELRDLTDPVYRSKIVVQNPATSSPGLVFLLSTIAEFGTTGDYTWEDYWRDLVDNDVLITQGWSDAYYGAFTGGTPDGDRPIVVSYATSPSADVWFSDPRPDQPNTAVLLDGCYRQIEFAGIVAGTPYPTEARQLIDFMLSVEFQEDMPLNMFVYPANQDAVLPEVFVEHSAVPSLPNELDPVEIEENREAWIETWTSIVR